MEDVVGDGGHTRWTHTVDTQVAVLLCCLRGHSRPPDPRYSTGLCMVQFQTRPCVPSSPPNPENSNLGRTPDFASREPFSPNYPARVRHNLMA